jgi:hypothetical protein
MFPHPNSKEYRMRVEDTGPFLPGTFHVKVSCILEENMQISNIKITDIS